MAHAEKCPVCNGTGRIENTGSTAVNEKSCHGCNGRGWIEVGSGPDPLNPFLPYPHPVPYSPRLIPYWSPWTVTYTPDSANVFIS